MHLILSKPLVIVGLPGSGKSVTAIKLAELSGLRHIDTDKEIVSLEGQSIADIFKHKGDQYFRKSEERLISELLHKDPCIISTGGGLPCFFNNMKLIQQFSHSLWLDWPLETIAQRLRMSKRKRPLFSGVDTFTKLNELLLIREPFYSMANHRLSEVSDMHPQQYIDDIYRLITTFSSK